MATNKSYGVDARKSAVRDRSQLKTKIDSEDHRTKRGTTSGHFEDQKKNPEAPTYEGIRWDAEPTD
jgi:hypothetical protein